jgi:hypothetical protein
VHFGSKAGEVFLRIADTLFYFFKIRLCLRQFPGDVVPVLLVLPVAGRLFGDRCAEPFVFRQIELEGSDLAERVLLGFDLFFQAPEIRGFRLMLPLKFLESDSVCL